MSTSAAAMQIIAYECGPMKSFFSFLRSFLSSLSTREALWNESLELALRRPAVFRMESRVDCRAGTRPTRSAEPPMLSQRAASSPAQQYHAKFLFPEGL